MIQQTLTVSRLYIRPQQCPSLAGHRLSKSLICWKTSCHFAQDAQSQVRHPEPANDLIASSSSLTSNKTHTMSSFRTWLNSARLLSGSVIIGCLVTRCRSKEICSWRPSSSPTAYIRVILQDTT